MLIGVDIDNVLYKTDECTEFFKDKIGKEQLIKNDAAIYDESVYIRGRYYAELNSIKGKKYLSRIGYLSPKYTIEMLCNPDWINTELIEQIKILKIKHPDWKFCIVTARTSNYYGSSNSTKKEVNRMRNLINRIFGSAIGATQIIYTAEKGAAMIENNIDILIDDDKYFISQVCGVKKKAIWYNAEAKENEYVTPCYKSENFLNIIEQVALTIE